MARKQESIIKGTFNHRRTETDYMRELLDAVPLEEWRGIVVATVAAAKAGDASARLACAVPRRQAGCDGSGPAGGGGATAIRLRSCRGGTGQAGAGTNAVSDVSPLRIDRRCRAGAHCGGVARSGSAKIRQRQQHVNPGKCRGRDAVAETVGSVIVPVSQMISGETYGRAG